jgi:hypothetical protein
MLQEEVTWSEIGKQGGHFIHSSSAALALPFQWFGSVAFRNLQALRWKLRRHSTLLKGEHVHSSNLAPCDSFLWGYVKEQVFVPPLPLNIDKFRLRITAAIETIGRNMLERVWGQLNYRLDVFQVRMGLTFTSLAYVKLFQSLLFKWL